MTSIRLGLLKRLIIPMLLVSLLASALTYWLAWGPAQLAFDQSLADNAWALASRLRVIDNKVVVDLPNPAVQILRIDHYDEIFFVVRDEAHHTILGDHDFPNLQTAQADQALLAYYATMRGEPVRVITLITHIDGKEVRIGVAETLRKRKRSQSEILSGLMILESLLLGVFVLVVWKAVGSGLRPVSRFQEELDMRKPGDLTPLHTENLPVELAPAVNGINDLLARLDSSLRTQREFIADVAHQIRTPLAGIQTHIEWLITRHAHDEKSLQSLELVLSSVKDLTRKSNQLMSLARAEPSRCNPELFEEVRLDLLVENTMQHFILLADNKLIDLGFELTPTSAKGDVFLLRDLLDNLVDNAIRYTPEGGRVTVKCRTMPDGSAELEVEDTGPGIPERARINVLKRHVRLDTEGQKGAGLGLAIVNNIVADHNASIVIANSHANSGTRFVVRFPA